MAVTRLVNAMGLAHREEIDLHMAEIEKREPTVTALVQPGYATFEGGHVVLRDLAYCPACGARVIGRGVE